MSNLSIFGGTGYIGSTFMRMYPDNICIARGERQPVSKDILYLISTTKQVEEIIFPEAQGVTPDIDTKQAKKILK